jgi:hypothetical protein
VQSKVSPTENNRKVICVLACLEAIPLLLSHGRFSYSGRQRQQQDDMLENHPTLKVFGRQGL